MLPPLNEEYHPGLNPNTPEEDFLIEPARVKEALKNAGKDVQRIDSLPGKDTRYITQDCPSRSKVVNTVAPEIRYSAAAKLGTTQASPLGSPGISRNFFPGDPSGLA